MNNPRHKNDTQTFEELGFHDQARSISAQIIIINKAIIAHIRRSDTEGRDSESTRLKCIAQVSGLLDRLRDI